MGIFEFIKKRKKKISITDFHFYYVYGTTDITNQTFNNVAVLKSLYQKVFGESGGVIVRNSFHPYFIVNAKGTTPWVAAYVQVHLNSDRENTFDAIVKNKSVFITDLSASFNQLNVWPDNRLTAVDDASKTKPFIIPFLVYKSNKQLPWTKETQNKSNGKVYKDSLTQDLRNLMSGTTTFIGLDILDEKNPSKLIDYFIPSTS